MPMETIKHPADGLRRTILVADDEAVNRAMLGGILENEYEVLYAKDGVEALEQVRTYGDGLSLILLDLIMPRANGLEVLRGIKAVPELRAIPVIVLTSDQQAEIESLDLGAIDFIPKPYPQPGVIQARVRRTIELFEDRQIIQSTERDPITGLYNKEFFFRYACQLDRRLKDTEMDAIVVDINHFRMVNERYGKAAADELLRCVGLALRTEVEAAGGIVCRREADTFLVYCPHRQDCRALLDAASVGLTDAHAPIGRVRLRMGVYPCCDREVDIERRFDRAKSAADTVRNSFVRAVAVYDTALHDAELYAEQLVEDFHRAIAEGQFKVFYQPKFDIRPQLPILTSAEALVRWKHPEMGMISPGVFIPLFEENGLIQELDEYVWRQAASQIRQWRERFGFTLPVSVNVSRIDMYDPRLTDTLARILNDCELSPRELLLEITESAYTQDSEQIIETVNNLRALGFRIEMDDFGTGYSSLNMISSLPIDALKLDMQFIRRAFDQRRDTRMLEVILDIADYLSVPVIAEGVETEEQLKALKNMGCDLVQGYYFSKPLPPEEYERFLIERIRHSRPVSEELAVAMRRMRAPGRRQASLRPVHALTEGYESIYHVDLATGRYVAFSSRGRSEDMQIERGGEDFFADVREVVAQYVCPEDRERVRLCLEREALLTQLKGDGRFAVTCRAGLEGETAYYSVTAAQSSADDNCLVMGVSRLDENAAPRAAKERGSVNALDFSSVVHTLSRDMETIYYVDAATGAYTEFSAGGAYGRLDIERSGAAFFEECRRNIPRVVYPDDRRRVASALDRDNLMATLRRNHAYSMIYRLVIDGEPVYYQLKAALSEDGGFTRVVIGVSNIDAQITEEQKLEAERQSTVTFVRIAQALSQDYYSIYYVNTKNDRFIEYSASQDYADLGLEKRGGDFFEVSRRNIRRVVYPEDLNDVLRAFTKENILRELEQNRSFSMSYRLVVDGRPTYMRMKATRMEDADDPHIVIGISNIDAEMRRTQATVTYSSIAQALAQDYFSIYYVDTETDRFIEYSSHEEYQELDIEKGGEDFFNVSRENILRVVHPEDQQMVCAAMDKSTLMAAMKRTGFFTLTYRLMFRGQPSYVHMKATRMNDLGDPHIVIGVSNIDAQVRREQAQIHELRAAREIANRDALTGVKSKHAFAQAEAEIDARLAGGDQSPFAVAVCDVNGLKRVNDTLGHKAGDQYIREACMVVCNIFKHSPVYRVGGDEFVAVLRGQDYDCRMDLLNRLEDLNRENLNRENLNGGMIIACGIAEYIPGADESCEAVFERADAAMYADKKRLKAER